MNKFRVLRVGWLADFPEPTFGGSELDGPWSVLPHGQVSADVRGGAADR
jgi:hypothetical protein